MPSMDCRDVVRREDEGGYIWTSVWISGHRAVSGVGYIVLWRGDTEPGHNLRLGAGLSETGSF